MLVPMGSSTLMFGYVGSYFVRCELRTQLGYSVIPGWSEGPDPESRDSGLASRPGMTPDQQKSPCRGFFRIDDVGCDQWALAQTFFLVKYSSTVSRIKNTNTCRPSALRASICGSAVHIRNVVTSLAYWATVAGEPSS